MNPICFVSLGPGDPDLLTLKACRALRQADIIMLPATGRPDGAQTSRALTITKHILSSALPDAAAPDIRLYALPMKADRTVARTVYERMKADARRWQAEGKRVAIGVEGDISIYASVHYLLDELAAEGIATEQTEGIPSFIAGAAAARLSLISGQERLLVVPGNLRAAEVEPLLESRHVLVVMKLSQCEAEVKAFMRAHPGREYHYFENISLPEACHLTDCEAILGRGFPYFSQLLIK